MVRAYMRGICNKSGHTCAPFNLYHGSRASALNERPRPHTNRWNGSPVISTSTSRTAAPWPTLRFVPRLCGSIVGMSLDTNRIIAASRHFARRRTTSLSPSPSQYPATVTLIDCLRVYTSTSGLQYRQPPSTAAQHVFLFPHSPVLSSFES